MGAENLLQSQSKKIERGNQTWSPDSDGVIESRKDAMQRNSKTGVHQRICIVRKQRSCFKQKQTAAVITTLGRRSYLSCWTHKECCNTRHSKTPNYIARKHRLV